MKGEKEHRIPLSNAAIALLAKIDNTGGYLFKGRSEGKPLSNMAMEMVLRRLGISVTVHGFRSSFRDWAGDATHTPREVVEAALAHSVGNSAEQAYRRGDALEKRRLLMSAWGEYCFGVGEPRAP
jgi:integrase